MLVESFKNNTGVRLFGFCECSPQVVSQNLSATGDISVRQTFGASVSMLMLMGLYCVVDVPKRPE